MSSGAVDGHRAPRRGRPAGASREGVLGLIGDEWKQKWGPLPGGTYQVPYADCYRCPFQLTYPDCGLFCLDFIRQSVRKTTAWLACTP